MRGTLLYKLFANSYVWFQRVRIWSNFCLKYGRGFNHLDFNHIILYSKLLNYIYHAVNILSLLLLVFAVVVVVAIVLEDHCVLIFSTVIS